MTLPIPAEVRMWLLAAALWRLRGNTANAAQALATAVTYTRLLVNAGL